MKATDLRIGNLVNYRIVDEMDQRKEWYEVSEIDYDDLRILEKKDPINQDYRPIQLTEEWLIKFGFINNRTFTYTLRTNALKGYVDELEFFFEPNEEVCITLSQFQIDDNTEVSHVFIRKIEYVHQLQNLYYSLTGKEL